VYDFNKLPIAITLCDPPAQNQAKVALLITEYM
jgi:hypothetical protein